MMASKLVKFVDSNAEADVWVNAENTCTVRTVERGVVRITLIKGDDVYVRGSARDVVAKLQAAEAPEPDVSG